MSRIWPVLKRTAVAFYDDQMTHHASALTYYALMSLFPAALVALSLLGLLGEYPRTYNAMLGYLRDVVPEPTLSTLDTSLRHALEQKGSAATALIVAGVAALYGTTGVLEAIRRALNVVFEVHAVPGRSFLRRKTIDVASSLALMALVLATLVLMFVGGDFARDMLGFLGLGDSGARVWNVARWPAALLVAGVAFTFVYYVTPDVQHRGVRWVTPGAVVAVLLWLGVTIAFSTYISGFADVSAVYGAFAAVIVLLVWLWLTNVVLLFGAELNAEIEREKELREGVPQGETLNRPPRDGS
ncbi:MAG TPA: YihY/virulence factor BrkB family protein [Solirubrobacteraceae bacterium]|nr:YihY/virulence factor BrkB family protein [Solirubrobacteraceae bacterium]